MSKEDTIFNEFSKLQTIKDIFDFMQQKYPGWIIDTVDRYSNDYPDLQNNWKMICEKSGKSMTKIVIVKNFEDDYHYAFAELLTSTGFIVRTIVELIPCSECRMAIPAQEFYNKMKEVGKNVPPTWKSKCYTC